MSKRKGNLYRVHLLHDQTVGEFEGARGDVVAEVLVRDQVNVTDLYSLIRGAGVAFIPEGDDDPFADEKPAPEPKPKGRSGARGRSDGGEGAGE